MHNHTCFIAYLYTIQFPCSWADVTPAAFLQFTSGICSGATSILTYINNISNISLFPEARKVIFTDDVYIHRPISCLADYEYVQDDIAAVVCRKFPHLKSIKM